jgi:tryptophanyl-tRNA synthetase
VLPEAKINEELKTIPGTDGQKMSKSYGNMIDIFDNYQNKVEFIYSYEDDVVSFTPMNIKRHSEYAEQIFDLFTEAEFLINISFDDFIIDSDFIKK